MFGSLYNVDEIKVTIFQPRMANISTWTINEKIDALDGPNGTESKSRTRFRQPKNSALRSLVSVLYL